MSRQSLTFSTLLARRCASCFHITSHVRTPSLSYQWRRFVYMPEISSSSSGSRLLKLAKPVDPKKVLPSKDALRQMYMQRLLPLPPRKLHILIKYLNQFSNGELDEVTLKNLVLKLTDQNMDTVFKSGRFLEQVCASSDMKVAALMLYYVASKANHLDAEFYYAILQMQGFEGFPADKSAALARIERNGIKGHGESLTYLALRAISGRRFQEGIKQLQNAADSGTATAQYELGRIYLEGLYNVPKNVSRALELLDRAAQSEHPHAMATTGALLIDPSLSASIEAIPEKERHAKSFKYLEKAASYGIRDAQYLITKHLFNSESEVYEPSIGLEYVLMANEAGIPEAAFDLAQLYLSGNRELSISVDVEQAKRCLNDAKTWTKLTKPVNHGLLKKIEKFDKEFMAKSIAE